MQSGSAPRQLLHQFIKYFKKVSCFYIQLQSYKRQLATFMNSINYTIPFQSLDVSRRGAISQKDLQQFLIQHNYYLKPAQIDLYFKKYVHGKEMLDYDDIMESLIPHSDFVLMTSAVKSIIEKNQNSHYLCKKAENVVISQTVALIVHRQIMDIDESFHMINAITNSSLQFGAALWRCLDRDSTNCLTLAKFEKICSNFNVTVSESEWLAFINWHFRSHERKLERSDFMLIFDGLIKNKRSKSACNLQRYAQSESKRKKCLEERKKQERIEQIVAERVRMVGEMKRTGCGLKQVKDAGIAEVNNKKILTGPVGYKIPKNCIKYCEVIID